MTTYVSKKMIFFFCFFFFSTIVFSQIYEPVKSNKLEETATTKKGKQRQLEVTFTDSGNPTTIWVEVIDGLVIMDGDIILGTEAEIFAPQAAILNIESQQWPNSTIPFTVASSYPDKDMIYYAINRIMTTTNICMTARTNETNYVTFVFSDGGCSSAIGMQSGQQFIRVDTECGIESTIHEILHAAGHWHEQSRHDREDYININYDNVNPDKTHNFNKYSQGDDLGDYDYASIMHYGTHAFSVDTISPTIEVKIPPGDENTIIGQRIAMSDGDVAAVNQIYTGTSSCNLLTTPANLNIKKLGTMSIEGTVVSVTGREIENSGSVATNSTDVTFYYHNKNTKEARILKTITIPVLASGEAYPIEYNEDLASKNLPDGIYTIGMWINFSKDTSEGTDEDNVYRPSKPELILPLQTCRGRDSLALVALYDATGGLNWTNKWDLTQPIGSWYGVTLNKEGCVERLQLIGNNLVGFIAPEIGTLSNLVHLRLSHNQLDSIPPEIGNLTKLESFYCESSQLKGSIPLELGNLDSLRVLYIFSNELTGSIPPELGNLKKLTLFTVHHNKLTGSIPSELGQLTNLGELHLSFNQLTGSIPSELGQLSSLFDFNVGVNNLTGNIPKELGLLNNLKKLSIQFNDITGPIPLELGQLSNLENLDIQVNKLNGELPPELGQLSKVWFLRAGFNQFEGCFPEEYKIFCGIHRVEFQNNPELPCNGDFEAFCQDTCPCGTPVWPGDFNNDGKVNITDVLYHFAREEGTAGIVRPNASTIWEIQSCPDWKTSIDGVNNKYQDGNGNGELEGTDLQVILANYHKTHSSGTLPPVEPSGLNYHLNRVDITNPDTVIYDLYLEHTSGETFNFEMASGSIDFSENIGIGGKKVDFSYATLGFNNFIKNNSNNTIDFVSIRSNYTATPITNVRLARICIPKVNIPTENISIQIKEGKRKTIDGNIDDIESDSINVPVNPSCTLIDSLALVALYNSTNGPNWIQNENWLSNKPLAEWYGISTNADGCVTDVNLYQNNLQGVIPKEIGNLSQLELLYLHRNELSGIIPEEFSKLLALEILFLDDNQLNGTIPLGLTQLSNLKTLSLAENELSGTIPAGIGNLTNLIRLGLNDNRLMGQIPIEIWSLTKLKALYLGANQLEGTIPKVINQLANIEQINLNNNQFSGNIPDEIGELTSLERIILSGNSFSGNIPSSIQYLTELVELDLRNNDLTGAISSLIGNLTKLRFIYLSHNKFSGSLPEVLSNLAILERLHLNHNEFSGSLPISLANLTNLQQLYLNDNQLSGCLPENYKTAFCNLSYDFSNNPDLPGGGDFTAFCENNTGACDCETPVWPGDINNDGIASITDVLYHFAHSGGTGPIRPDATTDWEKQCAPDWDTSFDGINCKYFDTDGNGVLNEDDLNVLSRGYFPPDVYNYHKTHPVENPPTYEASGLTFVMWKEPVTQPLVFSNPSRDTTLYFYGAYVKSISDDPFDFELLSGTIDFEDNPNVISYSYGHNPITDTTHNIRYLETTNVSWHFVSHRDDNDIGEGAVDSVFIGYFTASDYLADSLIIHLKEGKRKTTGGEIELISGSTFIDKPKENSCSDPVWPGDFNNDSIVNNIDVLYWGLTEGRTGQPRPNATTIWEAQCAPDWDTSIGQINNKHQDGNGDGKIDINDLSALIENYHRTIPDAGDESVVASSDLNFKLTYGGRDPSNPNKLYYDLYLDLATENEINLSGIAGAIDFGDLDVNAVEIEFPETVSQPSGHIAQFIKPNNTAEIALTYKDGFPSFSKNIRVARFIIITESLGSDNIKCKVRKGRRMKANGLLDKMTSSSLYHNPKLEFDDGGKPIEKIQIQVTDVSCQNLGKASILPFNDGDEIKWSTGSTREEITNLVAEEYTVTVNGRTYTFSIENDCDIDSECETSRTLSSYSSNDAVVHVQKTIIATCEIPATENVIYKAGENITLEAGFHAKAGSNFTAIIEACEPSSLVGNTIPVASRQAVVPQSITEIREVLKLQINPNPLYHQAIIKYELSQPSRVRLVITDIQGRLVNRLLDSEYREKGIHEVTLSAWDLSKGIYFVNIQTENEMKTAKMIVLD